ncbi:aldo/keto reductase [Nocardia sp. NPDC050193]
MSAASLPRRKLGDLAVPAIGFGAMTITQVAGYDVDRGRRTVHAALDAGVRLFDTADVYGPAGAGDGVNELALMDALRSWPGPADDIIVATKGGHLRFPETDTWWTNGSYEHLRHACTASIRRLGLDSIPLYHHHRPDPQLPYEESMSALRALHDEGLIARVGISNVDIDRIDVARSILGEALVSVQNEYAPGARAAEKEIRACEERGLAFLSWGPFGGMRQAKSLGAGGSPFAEIARVRGVSIHRVALAWQLHQSSVVIPMPGASRPESVMDSVAAASLALTADELALLNAPDETGS